MSDDREACEYCGKARPIMVVMERGRGEPWQLCSTCYLEGIRPMSFGTEKVEREVVAVIPMAPISAPAPVAASTTKTKRKKSA